jgi:Holliday junction resolvase-like predicted endonuclease
MTVEKEVVLALLRLTRSGPTSKISLTRNLRIPAQLVDQILEKLHQGGLFQTYGSMIETTSSQRIKMAIHALEVGADFELACRMLSWAEFEGIAAQAFEANGCLAIRNFHFKCASRKWEIDILALRKPLVLCVDCKHWKRGWQRAAIEKAVEEQLKRTEALANALPDYHYKAKIERWQTCSFFPIVLSLMPGPYKSYDDVPVVPILQVQDFINELPLIASALPHFSAKSGIRPRKLTDFSI